MFYDKAKTLWRWWWSRRGLIINPSAIIEVSVKPFLRPVMLKHLRGFFVILLLWEFPNICHTSILICHAIVKSTKSFYSFAPWRSCESIPLQFPSIIWKATLFTHEQWSLRSYEPTDYTAHFKHFALYSRSGLAHLSLIYILVRLLTVLEYEQNAIPTNLRTIIACCCFLEYWSMRWTPVLGFIVAFSALS